MNSDVHEGLRLDVLEGLRCGRFLGDTKNFSKVCHIVNILGCNPFTLFLRGKIEDQALKKC